MLHRRYPKIIHLQDARRPKRQCNAACAPTRQQVGPDVGRAGDLLRAISESLQVKRPTLNPLRRVVRHLSVIRKDVAVVAVHEKSPRSVALMMAGASFSGVDHRNSAPRIACRRKRVVRVVAHELVSRRPPSESG